MSNDQKTNSSVKKLIGGRSKRGSIDPIEALNDARDWIRELKEPKTHDAKNIQELKEYYGPTCRAYYTAAAVSRRQKLDFDVRKELLNLLFLFRAKIDESILKNLGKLPNQIEVEKLAATGFFGASAKQGVSIRYPLYTCTPSRLCGGRCYAHDGRDRELHLIFRAAINAHIGACFEYGEPADQRRIMELLNRPIDKAIKVALIDQAKARTEGYIRDARIRFSHIGEMSRHPQFANALAKEIKTRAPQVRCVIYTRHPDSRKLDKKLFIINFSIDNDSDSRRKLAPRNARLVNSAWDGKLSSYAEINFLEHHVEKGSKAQGKGIICPVSANHRDKPSCDIANCQACFTPVTYKLRTI